MKETARAKAIDLQALFELDRRFMERLGFFSKLTERQKQKWMKCQRRCDILSREAAGR